MNKITNNTEFCDGCCYRRTCSHDLEKCCYLVKKDCILKDGYVIRIAK